MAFIARMTFAAVRLAAEWADLTFITPSPVNDSRIRSIELYGPTTFNHEVRIAAPSAVDADVERWLCEAHRRGEQRTLDPTADVEPVLGLALERLSVPLRSRVVEGPDGLALRVPRYVVQGLAAGPYVRVRIGDDRFLGKIRSDDGTIVIPAAGTLESLVLGTGDETDLVVRADL